MWKWFWHLSTRRKSGPEAIGYAEIEAWSRMTGTEIRRFEISSLMEMDSAYLVASSIENEERQKRLDEKAKK